MREDKRMLEKCWTHRNPEYVEGSGVEEYNRLLEDAERLGYRKIMAA